MSRLKDVDAVRMQLRDLDSLPRNPHRAGASDVIPKRTVFDESHLRDDIGHTARLMPEKAAYPQGLSHRSRQSFHDIGPGRAVTRPVRIGELVETLIRKVEDIHYHQMCDTTRNLMLALFALSFGILGLGYAVKDEFLVGYQVVGMFCILAGGALAIKWIMSRHR